MEVYKIFNGKYDEEITSWLRSRHYESHYDLRGHQFSIYQSPVHFDIRKFNFANRVSHFGIVCQKLLFVLTLWIHLRIDWMNFSKTRNLSIDSAVQ